MRFTTDRCYLVTFVQTDPLFVITHLLEDAVPRVLGELKIPGFSSYLHPVNATHMIGVGRDADPATGTERGLQFSLFDVSDELNPRQVPCASSLTAARTPKPWKTRKRSSSGPRATCEINQCRRAGMERPHNSRRRRSRRWGPGRVEGANAP